TLACPAPAHGCRVRRIRAAWQAPRPAARREVREVVEHGAHDAFVDAVLTATDAVRLGDPFDARTTPGPLNNEAVAAKMDRHVTDGHRRGADLLRGGQRRTG